MGKDEEEKMFIEEVCELVAHWEVPPAGVREALHLCPSACEVMLPRSVYDGGSPPEPSGLLLHFALSRKRPLEIVRMIVEANPAACGACCR